MKRLKYVLLTSCLLLSLTTSAEDILQVVPFQASAGVTSDDAEYFSVVLRNDTEFKGLQFDIYLPEGMEFDSMYDPIELNPDRVPHSTGRGGVITWKMGVTMSNKGGGHYFVMLAANGGAPEPFEGNDGEVMKIYYTTTSDFAAGIHPIIVNNAVFAIDGVSGVKPVAASSYCWSGSQLVADDATSVDLSSLSGYIPSFVVEALNSDLAGHEHITSIDLSQADEIGASIVLPNKNGVIIAKEGSEVANIENAIATASGEEFVCKTLQLYDDADDFAAPVSFTAEEAGFDREYTKDYWSTVCLPFSLSSDQVAAIKNQGVEIESLTGFDTGANTVTFSTVDEMTANTPYIVRSSIQQTPFSSLENVVVSTSATMNDVTVGGIKLRGAFKKQTLNSTAETTYYAFNADDGKFVRIGARATVLPFRAYLELDNNAGAKQLTVIHDDNTTDIKTMPTVNGTTTEPQSFNIAGQRVGSEYKGIVVCDGRKYVKQ